MRNTVTALSLVFLLSGCTAMVDTVVKEPITPDPGSSSIGTNINDIKMDTFIGVNIKKADRRLKKSHINVHVYTLTVQS